MEISRMKKAVVMAGSMELLAGCAGGGGLVWDDERALEAVRANNYQEVVITDKDINAFEVELHCGSESGYTVSFDFSAETEAGEAVKGHLCANALGRSSIRGVELSND